MLQLICIIVLINRIRLLRRYAGKHRFADSSPPSPRGAVIARVKYEAASHCGGLYRPLK